VCREGYELIVPRRQGAPLSVAQSGSSRRYHLCLATASLLQDCLPLDIGLVIGVDGSDDVEGVLKILAATGVDHGPLKEHH
jgi:hypothetical protein